MYKFDVQKIQKELIGLSNVEKYHVIDTLMVELHGIRNSYYCKYFDEVWCDVIRNIKSVMTEGQLLRERIAFSHDKLIHVSSTHGDATISLSYGPNRLWQISISPDFIADDAECLQWCHYFAGKLNNPCEFRNGAIEITVEKEQLIDNILDVISTLCIDKTGDQNN